MILVPSTPFGQQQVQIAPPATKALLCGLAHYQQQLGYQSEHGPGLHVVSVHPIGCPYKVLVNIEQLMI
jgi:hypothetical protein